VLDEYASCAHDGTGNYGTQLANFDVTCPLDAEGHWLFRAGERCDADDHRHAFARRAGVDGVDVPEL
jgi:hypothetical protein